MQPEKDRKMLRVLLPAAAWLGAALLPLAGAAAPLDALKPLDVDIPMPDATFAGPGADAANNYCLVCHSADHVLNQPALPRHAWEEVVQKMITAYKAPIPPQDAAAIVDYLARTKGTK